MKKFFLLLSILILGSQIYAQTSLKQIQPQKGNYTVGFTHYTINDSTRNYSRFYDYTNKKIPRPIPVSIWYPGKKRITNKASLKVVDYLQVLKEEEEWEHLPNEQILNWFYYSNTTKNRMHLTEQTLAYPDLKWAKGQFPVVIYTPSFQASSIENFSLCEYIASHGFVVIASPSRGTETRWFTDNYAKEMETQARDVEFLMSQTKAIPNAATDQIALIGFSFGGLSNIIVQNRNDRVKAIVSLDGTERYQFKLLQQSPFFNVHKLDVPYLHMAQKEIPETVLVEDDLDASLNIDFPLFDSIEYSQAYKYRFHDLTHSHFSTLGVLFSERDPRQDKSDKKIMASYKLMSSYVLYFLEANLSDDQNSIQKFQEPVEKPDSSDLITKQSKTPLPKSFTYIDFNDLAAKQDYKNLYPLYESTKAQHPDFEMPETVLNTIGLQLIFNSETSEQGIRVFNFALQLYPQSANLYDSLAEGYLYLGNKEKAIHSFEKSLELNPQNQNAINRLKEMKFY